MSEKMWWNPTIRLSPPGGNARDDATHYVGMWGIVAQGFTSEVYCEPCATEVVRRVGERMHHSDAEKIPVYVRDQAICYSCGKRELAENPSVVYDLFCTQVHRLNRQEYAVAWGQFAEDGSYVTFCSNCGPKQRRPIEDTTTTMHRIWLRQEFACVECRSVIYPSVMHPAGLQDQQGEKMDQSTQNQEPGTKPATGQKAGDYRMEIEQNAHIMPAVVKQLLFAVDNFATLHRESEKAYSNLHLFKDLRKSAALPAIRVQEADDLEYDFQTKYDEALVETRSAEIAVESAHEQFGRVLENLVYNVTAIMLRSGSDNFIGRIPAWITEAIERAEQEHDAEIGEDR